MVKHTIAVDVDGVLADTPYEKNKKKRTPEFYAGVPPLPKAIETLEKLCKKHTIVILTSRGNPDGTPGLSAREAFELTKDWLIYYGIEMRYLNGIVAGIPSRDKLYVAHRLNCNFIVDDDPKVFFTTQGYFREGVAPGMKCLLKEDKSWDTSWIKEKEFERVEQLKHFHKIGGFLK